MLMADIKINTFCADKLLPLASQKNGFISSTYVLVCVCVFLSAEFQTGY